MKSSTMKFEQVWNKYIVLLEGQEISLANGGKNRILKVTNNGITRISSKGKNNFINIDVFKYAFNQVLKVGYISRKDINLKYPNRVSSGVIAVLNKIPFIELTRKPELGLKLCI